MAKSSPPQIPGAVPVLGHALALLRSPLDFLTSLPRYGEVVEIRIGTRSAYVSCTPALTRQVLLDDRTFDKGGLFYERAADLIGNGVGTCPHSQHREQRRMVQPAFRSSLLPAYARIMVEHISEMVDRWQEGQPVEVLTDLQIFTGRALLSTMFTAASHSVLSSLLKDLQVVQGGFLQRFVLPSALGKLPLPGARRYDRARAHLRSTIGRLAEEYRVRGINCDDLLSLLVHHGGPGKARDRSERQLSDEEITDQCLTFFIAGTETTAAALAWALHLVALHPGIQRELRVEAEQVLGPKASATFDDLPRLRVAKHVIMEAMRLYPPLWIATRKVAVDTTLGGFSIASGSDLVWSAYLVQRQPSVYAAPNRFDPNRWAHGDTPRAAPHRDSFFAFGVGARQCIGNAFGLTEATLTLATIAARWQLTHTSSTRVKPSLSHVLLPKGLLMVPERPR